MTPEQIYLIQASWRKVFPCAISVGETFYQRLFQLDPDLKPLFDTSMHKQIKKLFATLDYIVKGLGDLDAIVPTAQELAVSHVEYGAKNKDYDTVGAALLWALEQNLGKDFTPATREAWVIAYTTLASVMKTAATAAMKTKKQ